LATLSLFLLSTVLARWCIVLRGENKEQDYLAADQWLRRRGITARFLVLRDD